MEERDNKSMSAQAGDKPKPGTAPAFDAVTIKLASPERIREWSFGEVTKAETVNYRTQRSERNGLFDERVFGPEKDFQCYCGKYSRIRYKDIVCEKCGVEVTRSIVRRERMGHIELASPVAHIWFLRSIPSRIGTLLGITMADLEKVIYFSGYIVTTVNETEKAKVLKELDREYKEKVKQLKSDEAKDKLKQSMTAVKHEIMGLSRWKVLDEVSYHRYSMKYSSVFDAEIGAEAVYNIFKGLDLKAFYKELGEAFEKASKTDKVKLQKRVSLVKQLIGSGVRPEWMFLTVVPVIPPAIRPMVALDGGRNATSDVNDLYRRVINRNNRLKKLMDIKAPEVILRNEKRILQEAVDALIDNSVNKQSGALSQANRKPLKSLSDNIKGKHGRFRQNLLGKRVDYSARSVIVVGPRLKLSQCGLPKHMALELFKPFIINKLMERELSYSIRGASKLIEEGIPEVWEILEDVIKDKRVLLNRAPTLHRLGIQAFQPILIEGNAIQLHPLVCTAYNADFDGDQMAVHLPLSEEAQKEARTIMAAENNILGPGNNEIVAAPGQDIVLGIYWMTNVVDGDKDDKEIRRFFRPAAATLAYNSKQIGLRESIYVTPNDEEKYKEFKGKPFKTTVGRLAFNYFLPSDYPYVNKTLTKKDLYNLIEEIVAIYGIEEVAPIIDSIKKFGFRYATRAGISWGIDDVKIPEGKQKLVDEARAKVNSLEEKYQEGYISERELFNMSIEIWETLVSDVRNLIPDTLDKDGAVLNMVDSGARGKMHQVSQMAGMKGLVANPSGEVINFPIVNSFQEGLTPHEYFMSTHGARKGMTDTALNTAKAGYLTRKLVYVTDSSIITEEDCKDKEGRMLTRAEAEKINAAFSSFIRGRYLLADVKDSKGKVLYKKGELIKKQEAEEMDAAGASEVLVRSPLSCKSIDGVCSTCYGLDLARNDRIELGEAVGVIAAQAIGEPGTQFTMRTFHSGGVASAGGDITTGLPRVEEIFERRSPKNPALIAETGGTVMEIETTEKEHKVTVLIDAEDRKGKDETETYVVPAIRVLYVKKGDKFNKGDVLSDGSLNLQQSMKFAGRVKTEDRILRDVYEIYISNGASISRKHIEIVVRQMFSRRRITEPGDSKFIVNETVELRELVEENDKLKADKKAVAEAEEIILGIHDVSATTESWLSAASFEHTQRILTNTALSGATDRLLGLKENVIVGRLIPAGTGYREAGSSPSEPEDGDDSVESS